MQFVAGVIQNQVRRICFNVETSFKLRTVLLLVLCVKLVVNESGIEKLYNFQQGKHCFLHHYIWVAPDCVDIFKDHLLRLSGEC